MPFKWCYEDFCDFYERLTLPDGQSARLEGFQHLILREILRNAEGRQFQGGKSRKEDHRETLVIVPKGHAKTCLMAALGVYHLLVVPNAQVFAGAADLVQASEWYRTASHFVNSEPELAALAKVLGGTREIRSKRDGGFIKVLASDDSKQKGRREGFNPTAAFIDELHAHENDALFESMKGGLFKRNGFIVTISTAGWDLDGVLGVSRQTYLDAAVEGGTVERFQQATDEGGYQPDPDGRLTVARKASGQSVMLEWALADSDDAEDFAVVKKCNVASWVTLDSLRYAKESLSPWAYLRLRGNRWTLAYESWLPAGAWEALHDPAVPVLAHRTWEGATAEELRDHCMTLYPQGTSLVGFIDMARYRDCAAIVLIGTVDGLRIPRAIVWKSGGHDNPIPYEPITAAWRTLHDFYALRAVGYDEKYFGPAAEDLESNDGLPMELWPQSNERMCPAAANLRHAILTDKSFAHDGDPVLAAHIMAAVAKDVGTDQFKLVKSSGNGPPIDACVALACANALEGIESAEYIFTFPSAAEDESED